MPTVPSSLLQPRLLPGPAVLSFKGLFSALLSMPRCFCSAPKSRRAPNSQFNNYDGAPRPSSERCIPCQAHGSKCTESFYKSQADAQLCCASPGKGCNWLHRRQSLGSRGLNDLATAPLRSSGQANVGAARKESAWKGLCPFSFLSATLLGSAWAGRGGAPEPQGASFSFRLSLLGCLGAHLLRE